MNENLFYLAINIYHEARSEPFEGQVAVGHVVMNRAERRHISCKGVVLQPMQFSWHNGGRFPEIKEYNALLTSFTAAEKVLEERMDGNTFGGADHYFADYIKAPYWSKGMDFVCKIGVHKFYRS